MDTATLFLTHNGSLIRFLNRITRDQELSEEIACRVWCKVTERGLPAKAKESTPDFMLLAGMARGILSHYWRDNRSENPSPEVWDFVPSSCAIDTTGELLATLPPNLRSLAESIREGNSIEQWAESQGVSERTGYRLLAELRGLLS